MAAPPPLAALDRVLALQLAVAWAGEGNCEPPRLGWWKTDLVDPEGGGDLFARLMPRTHAWAALQAVREAAVQTEAALRSSLADRDALRSLFHLGFDVDERLRDRLGQIKRAGAEPRATLPGLPDMGAAFDEAAFAGLLRPAGGSAEWVVVPGGRELKGQPPVEVDRLALLLASALVPLVKPYPLPFCRDRA